MAGLFGRLQQAEPYRRLTGGADTATSGFDPYALAQAVLASEGGGGFGGGGGGYTPSFSETEGGLRLRYKLDLENALALQKRDELLQRQQMFTELLGKGDWVRALILGLGVPGQRDTRLANIEPLRGAVQSNLRSIMDNPVYVTTNAQGQTGIQGLDPVESVARDYQFGTGTQQDLLQSAFGVGPIGQATGLGGGLNPEEFIRRIQEVTPTGIL